MVSKARLDLPEPERPVTTIRRSRGNSIDMFLKLWTRAPWMAMVVLALPLIGRLVLIEKCQLVDAGSAGLSQTHGQRGFADQALIGEVFADVSHAADAEIALEVIVNFGGGARFAYFLQVFHDGAEEADSAFLQIAIERPQGRFDVLVRLLGVQQVGIDDLEELRVELQRLRNDFAAGHHARVEHLNA